MMMPGGKAKLRMKAMDQMMKDKPSIAIKIKNSPEMESEEGEMGEMEQPKGMESMPVTPEEKEMIMAMRKKMKMGMSMGEEGEVEEMGY
jgi:hypothetical protein